ncbi:MAG: diaminopimelate epimerase [Rickettsiella sp.]|nr:diaminopimelate epimerase [Rickettsiella sp.]
MKLVFSKMHVLNNEFIVINGVKQAFKPNAKLIRQWADRCSGIGFDQLLLIEKSRSKKSHFYYRIFNANGNEVAQCGNGALCVAQFLSEEKLFLGNPICLATKSSFLELELRKNHEVTANLGCPIFEPEKIPFISPSQDLIYSLNTPFGHFDCCILSLGNPHCIIQADKLEEAPVDELGDYLNQSPHTYFPQGINVEFITIKNPRSIDVRVYERGVGETQACGSGACAAVIAGRLLNRLKKNVKVYLPGGQLNVHWQGMGSPVLLTGKGETIFKGEIEL